MAEISNVLALDVGSVRIGVAVASMIARMPRPLTTLSNNSDFYNNLKSIIKDEDAQILVVGLPRGLDGQETSQTKEIQLFVDNLKQQIDLPIHLQDEALTSKKAEEELQKNSKPYTKEDIDSLAASYILEDFLHEKAQHLGVNNG